MVVETFLTCFAVLLCLPHPSHLSPHTSHLSPLTYPSLSSLPTTHHAQTHLQIPPRLLSPPHRIPRLHPHLGWNHRHPHIETRLSETPQHLSCQRKEGRWTVVYETDVLLSSVKSTRWEVMVGVGGRLWHLTVHWG